MKVGGVNPGTQYDQLNISGLGKFDGTIIVSWLGTYQPQDTDTFDLITYGSTDGSDFATKTLDPLWVLTRPVGQNKITYAKGS